jgi:hypothetical protein
MKAAARKTAPPVAPPTQLAWCKYLWDDAPVKVTADVARACMSGHDCRRPLSSEYWSVTTNAMYKLIEEAAK